MLYQTGHRRTASRPRRRIVVEQDRATPHVHCGARAAVTIVGDTSTPAMNPRRTVRLQLPGQNPAQSPPRVCCLQRASRTATAVAVILVFRAMLPRNTPTGDIGPTHLRLRILSAEYQTLPASRVENICSYHNTELSACKRKMDYGTRHAPAIGRDRNGLPVYAEIRRQIQRVVKIQFIHAMHRYHRPTKEKCRCAPMRLVYCRRNSDITQQCALFHKHLTDAALKRQFGKIAV